LPFPLRKSGIAFGPVCPSNISCLRLWQRPSVLAVLTF